MSEPGGRQRTGREGSRFGRVLIGAAVLSSVALASEAEAGKGPRSRVAIVRASRREPNHRELRTRLRAELEASGYEVVDAASRDAPRKSVEAALEECDAVAAVALADVPGGAGLDVWLSDSVTGNTLVRHLHESPEHDADHAPALLAVQTVEWVRAGLLEIEMLTSADAPAHFGPDVEAWLLPTCNALPGGCHGKASDEHPRPAASHRAPDHSGDPPDAETAEAGPEEHPIQLGASAALVWVRGLGVEGGPVASLGYVAPFGLDARLSLVGPLYGGGVDATHGSATVREIRLMASGGYRVQCVPGRFSIEPYLGLGAHNVSAHGSAEPPYEATSANAWVLALEAGLRAQAWLDPRFGIEIGAHAAVSLPAADVRIADEPVTLVDRPAMYGTAGLVLAP